METIFLGSVCMDLSAWAVGGGRCDVFGFLEGTASVGSAAAAPFPPALPSPAELVLISVYVQLDFSDDPWLAALSQPLTVLAASASSAPVTLTGLNLTTGGEEPLLTPGLSVALSCSGGRGCSGCESPALPQRPGLRYCGEPLPISWRVYMPSFFPTSHRTDLPFLLHVPIF